LNNHRVIAQFYPADNEFISKHLQRRISQNKYMREKEYSVYAMTNKTRTTIYIGVTNNLAERVHQHRIKANSKSFTAKYNINRLVWYEYYDDISEAITREKQIKGWTREKKINIIRAMNPGLKDLADDLM